MAGVIYPIVLCVCVCVCVCVFFLTVSRVVLEFFKCVINLTSFLFKSRFSFLLLFIHFFFLLIKQLFSHETVEVSGLFCLFLELKL